LHDIEVKHQKEETKLIENAKALAKEEATVALDELKKRQNSV
jgi:hypothetical protein